MTKEIRNKLEFPWDDIKQRNQGTNEKKSYDVTG